MDYETNHTVRSACCFSFLLNFAAVLKEGEKTEQREEEEEDGEVVRGLVIRGRNPWSLWLMTRGKQIEMGGLSRVYALSLSFFKKKKNYFFSLFGNEPTYGNVTNKLFEQNRIPYFLKFLFFFSFFVRRSIL